MFLLSPLSQITLLKDFSPLARLSSLVEVKLQQAVLQQTITLLTSSLLHIVAVSQCNG